MTIKKTLPSLYSQMGNCISKVTPDFIKDFGLSATKFTQINADHKFMGWVIQAKTAHNTYAKSWTDFGDKLLLGAESTEMAIVPIAPILPTMPERVPPGIRERFIDFADDIANNKKCTNAILVNLDLEPATDAQKAGRNAPNPKISTEGGHPLISYTKGKYSGVQIYKDSGDGKGFVKHDKSTTSKYKDESPLPPAGTAALWKYRLIYIKGNAEVGDFSNVIEITVTGL